MSDDLNARARVSIALRSLARFDPRVRTMQTTLTRAECRQRVEAIAAWAQELLPDAAWRDAYLGAAADVRAAIVEAEEAEADAAALASAEAALQAEAPDLPAALFNAPVPNVVADIKPFAPPPIASGEQS